MVDHKPASHQGELSLSVWSRVVLQLEHPHTASDFLAEITTTARRRRSSAASFGRLLFESSFSGTRVAADQRIHREARWSAALVTAPWVGWTCRHNGVRSVCGSPRVQGRSNRSALFSVSGLFCSLCGSRSSCGPRHSRISRALRVCRVPSPKTRHHLNPRTPRPGTVPVRTGQKAHLLALPMWLGVALQLSALLAYPLRSGGFLRVRKQS